ncbi:MAG: pyruvate kinase [Prevotella sp.]|nr:pyruvate kinase [Prevotella sp.]
MESNNQKEIKIICTIGPATESVEKIKGLADAGMSIARCNFSHGTHEEHGAKFAKVREVNQKYQKDIKIMLDTKGPDIRLRDFENGEITVQEGDTFSLYCDERVGNQKGVSISHHELYQYVKPGDTVLICNGLIVTKVQAVKGKEIVLKIEVGGKMSNKKSMAVPGVDVHLEFLRPADIEDLKFGVAQKVDMIAASFVNKAQDIADMRKIVGKTPIIAKIESVQAVQNLDEIIAAADGIMVARGDLGVEYPLEKLPTVQKMIIKKCNAANKFVVVATEMMLNMMAKPRPSRAETTDVANAVYDGTDAVMTSEETAMGEFPIQTIQYMRKITNEAWQQKHV